VSTEVDAHLSYDTAATVAKAHRLLDLYAERGVGRERIYIKIAATWEGIEACRQLQREGIDCNLTLLFSLAQAVACANAGAALVSPFVGRIMDYYKAKEGREFAPPEDPGVLAVTRVYRCKEGWEGEGGRGENAEGHACAGRGDGEACVLAQGPRPGGQY